MVHQTRPRQLALPFDDAPLWDDAGLEAALSRESARPLGLTLTENRSVLLSFRRAGGRVQLRLHRMFLHAPPGVVQALARSLKRTSRSADGEVRRFMNENLHRVRKTPRVLPALVTTGRAHDLGEIYLRLNDRFFGASSGCPSPGAAAAAGPAGEGSPSAATIPSSGSSASIPCWIGERFPSSSWRASSTTRCCTTTWGACPTAPGEPSTTRGLPPGGGPIRGTGRPWDGEGETPPPAASQPAPLDRERRAPRPHSGRRGRDASEALSSLPHLRDSSPTSSATGRVSWAGSCASPPPPRSPWPTPGCCATPSTTLALQVTRQKLWLYAASSWA